MIFNGFREHISRFPTPICLSWSLDFQGFSTAIRAAGPWPLALNVLEQMLATTLGQLVKPGSHSSRIFDHFSPIYGDIIGINLAEKQGGMTRHDQRDKSLGVWKSMVVSYLHKWPLAQSGWNGVLNFQNPCWVGLWVWSIIEPKSFGNLMTSPIPDDLLIMKTNTISSRGVGIWMILGLRPQPQILTQTTICGD